MEAKNTATPWIQVEGDRFSKEVVITTEARIRDSMSPICEMDVDYTGLMGVEQPANAAFIVLACNAHDELVEAAAKHLEWIDKERKGPVYPGGMSRDSEGGEAIWRKWWGEQLELCADTEALCRAALAKATGAA